MTSCDASTIASTAWVEIDWADQDGADVVPTAVTAWWKTPGEDPVDVSSDLTGGGTSTTSYVSPEFQRPGLHQLAVHAESGQYRDTRVLYWRVAPSDFTAVL